MTNIPTNNDTHYNVCKSMGGGGGRGGEGGGGGEHSMGNRELP